MIPELAHPYEARTRLIAETVLRRKRIFAMIELCGDDQAEERERLFAEWKELTKRIEALNR